MTLGYLTRTQRLGVTAVLVVCGLIVGVAATGDLVALVGSLLVAAIGLALVGIGQYRRWP